MSERTVYLVRHGEAASTWGEHPDPGLSGRGREQAKGARDSLRTRLDASATILSSPLQRARETAQPLADALAGTVLIDERFREIPSPVPLAQRQDWLRRFMGESWMQQAPELHGWREAILAALEEMPSQSVVVTHFLVLNTILGWSEDRDSTLVYWPANASITTAVCDAKGRWRVEAGQQMRSRVN